MEYINTYEPRIIDRGKRVVLPKPLTQVLYNNRILFPNGFDPGLDERDRHKLSVTQIDKLDGHIADRKLYMIFDKQGRFPVAEMYDPTTRQTFESYDPDKLNKRNQKRLVELLDAIEINVDQHGRFIIPCEMMEYLKLVPKKSKVVFEGWNETIGMFNEKDHVKYVLSQIENCEDFSVLN